MSLNKKTYFRREKIENSVNQLSRSICFPHREMKKHFSLGLTDDDFVFNSQCRKQVYTHRESDIIAPSTTMSHPLSLPFFATGSNILLWRRGSSVVTASNLMITRDPRFRLLDEYSLQIKGVRPQDAGDYICQIGDAENRDLVHTVEILVPPTVRAHPETGHVTARKGSSVTLECKASGNPVPNVYWVRVSKRVSLPFTHAF